MMWYEYAIVYKEYSGRIGMELWFGLDDEEAVASYTQHYLHQLRHVLGVVRTGGQQVAEN